MKSYVKSLLEKLDLDVVRLSSPIRTDHRQSIDLLGLAAQDLSQRLGRKMRLIQIGANDGEDEDPVKGLISDDLVEALLVEPMPEPFRILSERYRNNLLVHLRQCAIADSSGEMPLYVLADENGDVSLELSKMATLDKGVASQRREMMSRLTGKALQTVTRTVSTARVSDLLGQVDWDSVDIVVIDAEGWDANIVRAMLEEGITAQIIQFESMSISRREYPILVGSLVNAGYLTARSGYDSIALRG